MKYYYTKPQNDIPRFGKKIDLDHPVYKFGTLFEMAGKGLILVQQKFFCKYVYWDSLDFWLANDIFEHPGFQKFFDERATETDYPIIQVRSAMWALRMKPLPKEEWEEYF